MPDVEPGEHEAPLEPGRSATRNLAALGYLERAVVLILNEGATPANVEWLREAWQQYYTRPGTIPPLPDPHP